MALEDRRREWFDFGRVFSRAFGTLQKTAVPALLICMVLIFAPQMALYLAACTLENVDDFERIFKSPAIALIIAFGVLSVIGYLVAFTALTHLALSSQSRRAVSFGESLGAGVRLFLPVLGLTILVGLGTTLGYILLIVPGIILSIMWSVALPARLQDGPGVTAAMEESSTLTKGVRWPIFGLLILAGIISYLLSLIGSLPLIWTPEVAQKPVLAVLQPVSVALSMLVSAYGPASLYHELKWGDRDPNEEATAEMFA